MHTTSTIRHQSVLATLRALVPSTPVTFAQALRVAEHQAEALRQLTGQCDGRLDDAVIGALPRLVIERRSLPVSGASHWDGENWRIYLNQDEPVERQRFTLLHEYKHIVDYGHVSNLYQGQTTDAEIEGEQAADYFAGCALVPDALLRQVLDSGSLAVETLAQHFEVSTRAIEVRLEQTGLSTTTQFATTRTVGASQ